MISPDNYLAVREKHIHRVNKIIDYADSNTRCRSVILLDYFGEESDRCGICDVCRDRNELDLSKYEFDLILDEIKRLLTANKYNSYDLVSIVNFPGKRS